MNSKKKVGFEENLNELEELVANLENGKLGLEESLATFEKGVELYKSCQEYLNSVEKKVQLLTDKLKEIDIENE